MNERVEARYERRPIPHGPMRVVKLAKERIVVNRTASPCVNKYTVGFQRTKKFVKACFA